MSRPTPIFRDAKEIIDRLSTEKSRIAKEFERRESLEQIVKCSVGSNTFRAFRGLPMKPSVVFRGWASAMLADKETIATLSAIGSGSFSRLLGTVPHIGAMP
jgi:hypothetical protein